VPTNAAATRAVPTTAACCAATLLASWLRRAAARRVFPPPPQLHIFWEEDKTKDKVRVRGLFMGGAYNFGAWVTGLENSVVWFP
jgi:hypothetical protein